MRSSATKHVFTLVSVLGLGATSAAADDRIAAPNAGAPSAAVPAPGAPAPIGQTAPGSQPSLTAPQAPITAPAPIAPVTELPAPVAQPAPLAPVTAQPAPTTAPTTTPSTTTPSTTTPAPTTGTTYAPTTAPSPAPTTTSAQPTVAPTTQPLTAEPTPTSAPAPAPRTEEMQVGAGAPSGSLPPPRSDNDPRPPVAAPTLPTTGVTRQAGVGGTQAYGRAGVLELGGSAGFAAASNYSRFEVSPSIGLFVVDNLQLSLLTAFNHFRIGDQNGMSGTNATELKALIEPSFHLPLSQTVFGFLGMGAGVNYITEGDAGFALQPRIGANFLIGRSGVLTPALNMTYSTVEALRTPAGTLLAIQTSYGMNIGYTVMW